VTLSQPYIGPPEGRVQVFDVSFLERGSVMTQTSRLQMFSQSRSSQSGRYEHPEDGV
jgi:hypothetical protein